MPDMRTLAALADPAPPLTERTARAKSRRERRRNVRFPIALPVRYSLAKCCGWGRILNIGSGGALLTLGQPVSRGQRVELCIGWPVLLHEKVHLNLIAEGLIVRAEEGRAAVRFERCNFRTAGCDFRRQAQLPVLRGANESHA